MTDLEQLPATAGPTDADLLQFVNRLFTHARQHKRRYLERWERYDRMMRNRTWSDLRAAHLPSPSSSEFFPTVHTLVAWMTDQAPEFYFGPHPDLRDLDHVPAEDLVARKAEEMQILVQSWYLSARIGAQVERALWDMFTFGAAILRTGYDPSLDGGRGQVTAHRVDPWAVLPDPDATCLEDAKFFLEVRQVSLVELIQRYPERGWMVEPTDRADYDRRPRLEGRLEPISQPGMAATGVTGLFPGTATPGIPPLWPADRAGGLRPEDYTGTALLIECSVREVVRDVLRISRLDGGEEELVIERPVWRHVAVAGNVVLTPQTHNPFDHGDLPYVRLPMVEAGEFWGIPLAEHILPAQVALNRLLAAIQINLELTGNPVWLEPSNSGTGRTKITNQPGTRLTYNMGGKPEWATPPQMPGQVPQTIQFWRDTIDRISGISAVARGANLRRREAAQAVDAVQEASFVRVRAILRNMELALQRLGDQIAANVVQFYAEPRTIPEIGESGTEDYLTLAPNHFTYPAPVGNGVELLPLRFAAWIEAGSSQPISRAARVAEYETLRFQNALSLDTLLKIHRVPNRAKEIEKIKEEQALGTMATQRQNPRRSR